MFGKKKEARPKRDHSGKNLAQYGLFDVPTNLSFDGGQNVSDNDSDLEAELSALAKDSSSGMARKPPKRQPIPTADLDNMVSESMKDIPSDEDLSGDDDDPELLNELQEITGEEAEPAPEPEAPLNEVATNVNNLLNDRLKMYELAESNAKTAGETSRARRFNRGAKTLRDLIKQANAGKSIINDDIPPEVSTTVQAKAADETKELKPLRPAPEIPKSNDSPMEEQISEQPQVPAPLSPENQELLVLLNDRKDQYKVAALKAKKSGDTATAIDFIKIAKQFEVVINAVESGQAVDLSRMPGPPPTENAPNIEQSEVQNDSDNVKEPQTEGNAEENLISANSIGEALQQRLEVYKGQETKAKEEGNSSKARRMGRIVKQYEQAIKLNSTGKPVPVDDLPTPPGYAPIPVPGAQMPKKELEEAKPVPSSPTPGEPAAAEKPPPPNRSNSRVSGNHVPTTRTEKQVALLLARQKEFKEAALSAKKKGEISQAKEFLRTTKGFDPLINAAQGGLPVDIASLPISPSARSQLDDEYHVVMAQECDEDDSDATDMMSRLEDQLTKQLKMCLSTRDHHKALGDVAGTNRFEQLALRVTKDLDVIRLACKTYSGQVPKFHYETKDFSIVKSYIDLGDNDLELTIVRGVNYNVANPKEVDTYVKFEFPFPQDEPVRNKTVTVKDSNNPEYNATFILPIQRTSRNCLRVFKRHGIKFEIYTRGGFFRGDALLGSAAVKLQPLETQCELHESFDLLDGRKKVGGKLEVRLRVRHPLLTRQVEQLTEKWLVIDH